MTDPGAQAQRHPGLDPPTNLCSLIHSVRQASAAGRHPPAYSGRSRPPLQIASLPMTDGRRDLISRQTRRAFRDLATDVYVKAIAEYWQDQQFTAVEDANSQETSVRRRKFDEYAHQVDWSD